MEKIRTDILIIGMGAAGQFAALHAYDENPDLDILIVTKALRGKGGCSRMVQGGFNVVLHPEDSDEKHFIDTLKGGQFINNQELAMTLVTEATPTIKEMENRYGCFFDRNPDGSIHQKPFAGQCFDRTVHKGDLTGIEIISRATEQVQKRGIPILEEHRALELVLDPSGQEVAGALLLDIRRGAFLLVQAAATLVATGGGPTQYRIFAPSLDKSLDGLAMLYRAGVWMLDMEMVQFHPTGLVVKGSVVSGTLLEEGLRGAGAHLLNRQGERFMARYDPQRLERATRDVVSRASFMEIMAGRGLDNQGVHLVASHLGSDFVLKNFPGMCARCSDFGYELAREPVPVSPTAHYMMGGAAIDTECHTSLARLFCAGEDSGGVHGANRLGGNGIADSCVFGRLAGKAMARFLEKEKGIPEPDPSMLKHMTGIYTAPFSRNSGPGPLELRDRLRDLNWTKAAIIRSGRGLIEAREELEGIAREAERVRLEGPRQSNPMWTDWINLRNMVEVSRLVVESALLREESRGAHYREDHPRQDDDYGLFNVFLRRGSDGRPVLEKRAVELKYMSPGGPKD